MSKQIKQLRLKNFQSHEDTVLDFVPGLNVLLGNSDTGKSAIVRAIRWLFYNEPAGDEFLQRGKSLVEVEAEFYDGSRLKRSREKGKNAYDLTLASQESMHFEGFGRTVPKEIVDYFHLKKFPLGLNEDLTLNIADQLEGPFLLQEKDSNKANAIGRLVGIHYIDQAQRNVNRDIVGLNRDKKYQEDQLTALEEGRKSYDYIEDALEKLDAFKELLRKGRDLEDREETLQDLLDKFKTLSLEKKDLAQNLEGLKNLDQAQREVLASKDLTRDYHDRLDKQRTLLSLKEELEKSQEDLRQVKDLDKAEKAYKEVAHSYGNFQNLLTYKKSYEKLDQQIREIHDTLGRLENLDKARDLVQENQKAKALLDQYKALENALKDIEDRKARAKVYMDLFLNLEEGIQAVEGMRQKKDQLHLLEDYLGAYRKLQSNKKALEEDCRAFLKEETQSKEELKVFLKDLKLCPLCKRPMDEHTIQHMIGDEV